MDAICRIDFRRRVEAHRKAKQKQKELEELLDRSRAGDSHGKPCRETRQMEQRLQELEVPAVGYHDFYGVWFAGKLFERVREIAVARFGAALGPCSHVFIDVAPTAVPDGVSDLTTYGHRCRLYKWTAQGFHRGLVVLASCDTDCQAAAVYLASGTWSWVLDAPGRRRLPEGFCGWDG